MTKADRYWASVVAVLILLLLISWLYPRGATVQPVKISAASCDTTTAGNCESLLANAGFWEAQGRQEYMITFDLLAAPPGKGACYSLGTGAHGDDSTKRMPKQWSLHGSVDGKAWEQLDSKEGDTNWKQDETRQYPVQWKSAPKFLQMRIRAASPGDIIRIYRFALGDCPKGG